MQAMYHFAKNNYRKFSHWHSSSVVLTHTTCTWGLHYIFRSGLSAFFIIADFFCCADLPYFRYQIRTREVLHKNMHGRWLNQKGNSMQQLQFILFFTTLFLSILQTPSELKIAKLSWMLLCVHAKLCSKNVFGAIYLYVGYSVFLCYSLECLTG